MLLRRRCTPKFCWIRFDWNRSINRSKWFRCDFWSFIRVLCDLDDALTASVVAMVIGFDVTVVDFFDLCLSSGKHPVVLFNCSIDWYMPISDETIDSLRFDAFNSSTLSLLALIISRFVRTFGLPMVVNKFFIDGTGDGVVSKRVIPSNNTCVLMSLLSGSSLNMDTRFR